MNNDNQFHEGSSYISLNWGKTWHVSDKSTFESLDMPSMKAVITNVDRNKKMIWVGANPSNILDCVRECLGLRLKVHNASCFHVGQRVRVRENITGPDKGTIVVTKVKKYRKSFSFAINTPGFRGPKVGDFLLVAAE